MTTITREQQKQILIDTANHVISRDNTSPYSENLRELARIALASLEAEPVAYIFKHPAGELFWSLTDESNKGQNDVMPVYAAQPVQETGVYKDMLNIIGLLEKNEWAEHCTSTVLGSLLESEITRLVSKEQPASVVPEEHYQRLSELYHAQEKRLFKITQRIKGPAFDKYSHSPSQAIDVLESALFGENEATCRAAMLQGSQPVSQTYKLNELSGNSPVIPDGWISCSERMPEQGAYISAVSKHGEYVAGQVIDDWLDLHDGTSFGLDEVYLWMMLPPLLASPQQ
ncbi:EaA protein [Salmonella phage vB_SosS_Oslo]|uniref:EaA protein n=1 Tax=Salmonella phage vB_SosS_Oslo TaxID=1168549 RepID=UPI00026891D7|nr:EaA protein [Salmonella phage vB_SosS_Oslo]AFM54423.1 EaA protein [Salmonella phage vB_SosS_Oslo]